MGEADNVLPAIMERTGWHEQESSGLSATTYPPDAVGAVVAALKKHGIISASMQAAILATIAKESGFVPRTESSYRNTSNTRIRSIFGARVSGLSESGLTALKADDVAFFDKVYGGKYGNTAKGDGFKYRGRGFNGITFKSNYERYGKLTGVDLVAKPDKCNEIAVAADVVAIYFKDLFDVGKKSGDLKKKIGVNDVNEIKDLKTAVKCSVQANAGWKTDLTTPFGQENINKAMAAVGTFVSILADSVYAGATTIKNNPGKAIFGILLVAGAVFAYVKRDQLKLTIKRLFS